MSSHPQVPRPTRALGASCLLALLFLTHTATAQEPQPPQDPIPATNYTLHVYTDLLQIPTIVLNESLHPLPPLHAENFFITLDEGPRFHPTHVRPEGNDPLSIAILLDASGSSNDLLDHLPAALDHFAATSLQLQDHVTLYALDCKLVRAAQDISAYQIHLQTAAANALHSPVLHGDKKRSACAAKLPLWNALAVAAQGLATQPGRRVILAITEGLDTASSVTWPSLRAYATGHSITVLGLSPTPEPGRPPSSLAESHFTELCQLSGGLVLNTYSRTVPRDLSHLVELLRSRYILEFPRPGNTASGEHIIDVTLFKKRAFIRPAGITVPIRDTKRDEDPTNVPFDPTRAPVMGDRHSLPPHS